MSSEITCRFCSAKLPAYIENDTCPECNCSLDLQDNNPVETQDALDQPTIKPSTPNKPHVMGDSAELIGSDFGDYRLLEEIARGGMGVVFRAQQKSLDRFVALKMILDGALASEIEIDRFKIEAQAAAQLDHPNIVPVYEIGQLNSRHYFSMALVEGESLADRIKQGPLTVERAADMLLEIAEGMDFAHQRGVIHRDLKPANILLDANGTPRITDFGLAKRPNHDQELTATGQTLGTPSYMAPEQASGKDVSDATDVYALGAILYAMVTGKPPFESDTLLGTLTQVIEQEPQNPRNYRGDLPLDLETICLKCLEKDPAERYGSARELIEELKRFKRGEPIEARPLSGWGKLKRWRRIIARNRDVRLQSSTKIMGYPLVDIAFGRDHDRTEEFGNAKGIIALGDRATGIIAYGGFARGVLCMGMYAMGLVPFGLFSVGLVTLGLFSLGVFATGGLAVGIYSFGFCAIGYKAMGMIGLGYKAWGAYSWSFASTAVSKVVTKAKQILKL